VQYRLVGPGAHLIRGTGVSLNFSRTGIEFTTNVPLPVGGEIEFSVNWPAELNAQCALKFMGTGRVVRAADDRAAVKICKYEFRTRRKQSAEPRVMQPEVLDGTDTRTLPPLGGRLNPETRLR
jgi:hypothetical protein